ncbi:ATP-binding protein [Candidatus Poriferisodalis sp.]|uniref:ATP-binding protein n=1 Tax=Candidatus Poriferisodalis sp. TaxID=3101277 RepID=UPI003B026B0B
MAAAEAANPFAPTFGAPPPLLAGRDGILQRFDAALDTGPTHPDYTLLVTGDRGTGKTALLNALEDRCVQRGWLSITAAATSEPLSSRIVSEAVRHTASLQERPRRTRVRSVSALGVGVELDDAAATDVAAGPTTSLLSTLERVAAELHEAGSGLLITIDELHDATRDDVRDVASAVQIVTRRQQRPVAFAAAALALIEDTHLADVNMTFLQRCARARLGALSAADARTAIIGPIRDADSDIDDDALTEAVAAALGYPYMIQLIGFHAWNTRERLTAPISVADVRAAIIEANDAMVDQVANPIWNRLSPMDRRFLVAMLDDEESSSLFDVAERLGRDLQYTRVYRRRLVSAGAIRSMDGARVAYRHQALRKRSQAAARDDPNLFPSRR